MNNLKKFATEAEYSAATLNYPAVSWITANDSIHFDKATPSVNDKIMMAWHSPSEEASGKDIVLWNGAASDCGANISAVTVNNEDIAVSVLENASEPDTDYLVKYSYSTDSVCDAFAGDLGGGWGSDAGAIDFLVPSQVTEISSLPQNVGSLVVEAATPPTVSFDTSSLIGSGKLVGIYVPDNAVSVYKTEWALLSEYIYSISEYQGLLPV